MLLADHTQHRGVDESFLVLSVVIPGCSLLNGGRALGEVVSNSFLTGAGRRDKAPRCTPHTAGLGGRLGR